MKYCCTFLLLLLSLWATGQPKPLADRVAELEQLVKRLDDRVLTLEAVNRILADERKALRDSLFWSREAEWRTSTSPKSAIPDKAMTQAAPHQYAPRTEPPVTPAGSAPAQGLMAVTPAPETKPALPLAASSSPTVRSSPVSPKAAAPRARPTYRNYIRGPRGGCYYINSSGNKTYVDRSMCG